MEHEPDKLNAVIGETVQFTIGNRMVLENAAHNASETVTIKGDDAGLEEGILALKKGAFVTDLNLIITEDEQQWQLTIKGESFNITGLKVPETGKIETREDIEGAVLEKIFLYEKIMGWIDAVYAFFLGVRLSSEWDDVVIPQIKKWILQ